MIRLPWAFRTPVALVNLMPFGVIGEAGTPGSIFIPKKYYSAEKGRLLTFCEVLSDRRLAYFSYKMDPEFYDSLGLEIQENTPEEVSGLATEVDDRLKGTFAPTQEDEELQHRFLNLITSHTDSLSPPFENYQRIKIGSHFLRTHPELLE